MELYCDMYIYITVENFEVFKFILGFEGGGGGIGRKEVRGDIDKLVQLKIQLRYCNTDDGMDGGGLKWEEGGGAGCTIVN